MNYTFEIVGVSPVISFFTQQQDPTPSFSTGAEYLGSYRCTLDAFIESIEPVPPKRGWDLDQVVDTVVHFWLNNAEQVTHWKRRLEESGRENLLVARLADVDALRTEFERLVRDR